MNYEGAKDETNPLKTLISSFRFHPSVFRPWLGWRALEPWDLHYLREINDSGFIEALYARESI